VTNEEGKRIEAMIITKTGGEIEDTILYLHGNGGSKMECINFCNLVCECDVNVICFDFIGCGNSEKGMLTYGVKESEDIKAVIE
jgi:pimeloyl-ACP methyl ester carboxylesterase